MGNCVKRETGLEFYDSDSADFKNMQERIYRMKRRIKQIFGVKETEIGEKDEDEFDQFGRDLITNKSKIISDPNDEEKLRANLTLRGNNSPKKFDNKSSKKNNLRNTSSSRKIRTPGDLMRESISSKKIAVRFVNEPENYLTSEGI